MIGLTMSMIRRDKLDVFELLALLHTLPKIEGSIDNFCDSHNLTI
jgi:hypothetical protein